MSSASRSPDNWPERIARCLSNYLSHDRNSHFKRAEAGDITYIRLAHGFVYLVAVIDG